MIKDLDALVYEIRKYHGAACATINVVYRDSSIISVSAAQDDKFIINMSMDHLYHLLSNDNNRGERKHGKMDHDYLEICDKMLLLKLKSKIDAAIEMFKLNE